MYNYINKVSNITKELFNKEHLTDIHLLENRQVAWRLMLSFQINCHYILFRYKAIYIIQVTHNNDNIRVHIM